MIIEILRETEADIDSAVQEAFAAGYKAASLRYAPDAAASEAANKTLREALNSERIEREAEQKKTKWFWPALVITGVLSLTAGTLAGVMAMR
jgi:hypothetical protein